MNDANGLWVNKLVQKKKNYADLALFSGAPSFGEKLHVGRPNIGDRDILIKAINEILDHRWLTNNGPFVQRLEDEIADLLGVKHCIAINNGTVALEIAIRALGLTGEVILPSFTFIATAHALKWLGLTPVFCDVDPQSHNLNPKKVAQLISPRTTGILGVHLWGRPCDVQSLRTIAEQYNLKLLFDAAHAFGCSYKKRMIGNFGNAEVFSFHATKFFNTLEGGAITTNDDKIAHRMRLIRNFGFSGYDEVSELGINGKMNEFSAAMGLTSLKKINYFIDINLRNYQEYSTCLEDIPGIQIIQYDPTENNNYQYIVVEIDEVESNVSRDLLVDILWAENVLARRYFYPSAHRMEPYRSLPEYSSLELPETERLSTRLLLLPTGETIRSSDIQAICQILKLAVENSAELHHRLRNG